MRTPLTYQLVLAVATLPLSLPATTYYVDRANPLASDANPGSEASPWLTIQHAASTLVAGDTVYVKAGTYPEQVVVANSGSAGQEIVFTAYPGHTVIIDGATVSLPEWVGLFYVSAVSYIRVSGFDVVNTGPNGHNTGIQVDDASNVVVEHNHTAYTASSGILVWGSSNVLVDGNEVEQAMALGGGSFNECITVGRSTGVEVRSNHVHDGNPARGEGICLKDGSSFVSAHHNHVHNVQSVGIYVDAQTEWTHDIDVYANRVHDTTGGGIVVASEVGGLLEHVRVYNNVSYHNQYLGLEISSCCIASHPMSDIALVNNSVWGNGLVDWGGGIANGNDQAAGVLVRNNASSGNLSFEIAFEGVDPSGSTVDHNLVDGWDGYPGELCGTDCQLGDPLWVAPANGDLHLQAGSPAIDHGSSLLAPADDLDGNPRPLGAAFDIGAYEYGDTSAIFSDGFESGTTSAWSATVP